MAFLEKMMKTEGELKQLHSGEYVERFVKEQSPRRITNLVDLIKLDKGARVVDFGCGSGLLMPFVCSKAASYTGVDFSQEFIDQANINKSKLNMDAADFVCSSIETFSKENAGKFDAAFALDLSEHVYDEEWIIVLRAIRQSLKPEGVLYLHTPNGDYFLEIMKKHNFLLRQFPEHVAVRTLEENVRLLERAGLSVSSVKMLPHYNFLKWLHLFSYLPIVGRYFKARIFIESLPAA